MQLQDSCNQNWRMEHLKKSLTLCQPTARVSLKGIAGIIVFLFRRNQMNLFPKWEEKILLLHDWILCSPCIYLIRFLQKPKILRGTGSLVVMFTETSLHIMLPIYTIGQSIPGKHNTRFVKL